MRKNWIVVSIALLALLGTGFWGYNQYQSKKQLETNLAARYQSSFYQLSDHMEKLQVLMAKGLVTTAPSQNMVVYSEIWHEANAARDNLSEIPVNNPSMTRINKFLTQVGDFAYTLNKKGSQGKPPQNADWDKLSNLHRQVGYVNQELNKVETSFTDNMFQWTRYNPGINQGIKNGANSVGFQGLNQINEGMKQYPALVYDGPFSEHLTKRKPIGLTGENISADLAKAKVQSFMDGIGSQTWRANYAGLTKGPIPAYAFELTPVGNKAGNQRISAEISKKGGHLLWFLNARPVNRTQLSRSEAIDRAETFLRQKGMPEMTQTYSVEQQNIVTISFAGKTEDVVIYPDIINIKVALDNGEILGWEALNYYSSHHVRSIPKPKISQKEAQQSLNPRLKIKSTKLALIPDDIKKEKLCWEFNAYLDQDQFLIYVNALTGNQEKILKIVPTQNGKLAM